LFFLLLFNFIEASFYLDISKNKIDQNILTEIENHSLYIQNDYNLDNIYYLTAIDSFSNSIGVAYFLDWNNEFPDFGKTYKTNFFDIIYQLFIPIFYTNWLYIPNTGGMQRILYGKHDIEGIWAIYDLKGGKIDSLRALSFETTGHKAVHYSSNNPINNTRLVSKNNCPFINIITWNHMLGLPNSNQYKEFKPIYFSEELWLEYNMDNNRSELIKILLKKFKYQIK
tara:strand:- start:324 stop:1001 length:678 start_codon:yes stop_codon:yes gene_type:complete